MITLASKHCYAYSSSALFYSFLSAHDVDADNDDDEQLPAYTLFDRGIQSLSEHHHFPSGVDSGLLKSLVSPLCNLPPYSISPPGQKHSLDMRYKRRSLEISFIPALLQRPSSSEASPPATLSQSQPAAAQADTPSTSDPFSQALSSFIPSDSYAAHPNLLDDDPFANLSIPRVYPAVHAPIALTDLSTVKSAEPQEPASHSSPSLRHSALRNSPRLSNIHHIPTSVSTSPPSPVSFSFIQFVSPPGLARPAYTRPAVKATPSLPSLRVLARGEIIPTKKIRRGRVGAKLPLEPWNSIKSQPEDRNVLDDSASWLSDLDTSASPALERSQSFDQDQCLSSRVYEGNFNISSGNPPSDSLSIDDQASVTSFLSRNPSEPSSSHSWDTLSALDLSRTSSLTAYSTESDSQLPSSSTSSVHSHSDSVHLDLRPVSDQIYFDVESFRKSKYSPPGSSSPSSISSLSRSHSTSSASDLENSFMYASGDPRLSDNHESGFQPGTSAETIRPRISRSPSVPHGMSCYFDSDPKNSMMTSPDEGFTPCNSVLLDEEMGKLEIGNMTGLDNKEDFEWMEEPVDGGESGDKYQGRSGHSQSGNTDHLSTSGGCLGRLGSGGGGSGSGGGGRDGDDDRHKRGKDRSPHEICMTSGFLDKDDEEDNEKDGNSDSDDVPLARSIPTALRAQRTIRREVRNEAAQRRQEKALKAQAISASVPPTSQLDALKPITRPRTRTLPSQPVPSVIAVDDLTRKLLNVQATCATPAASSANLSRSRRSSEDVTSLGENKERSRRAMRSIRRPRTAQSDGPSPQMPTHSPTISRYRRGEDVPSPLLASRASIEDRRVDRSKSTRLSRGHKFTEVAGPHFRSFGEQDGGFRAEKALPTPPLPTYEAVMSKPKPEALSQQRIFIGDLQRFNVVEVGSSTSAQDIVDTLDSQGELQGSGWMLFELAQDFGMERPIRSFELLSDVTSSWNMEKTVNMFVLKRTQLGPLLAVSAMPTSSPTCRGYIDYEVKRGKWSKRWMELREHSLWLSKRDSMKDETFLCKLSNFDVYSVTRVQKSPKPFVFAVKSTDNLAFFEDTADYFHTFSCKEKEGLEWMSRILLARSYVLYQERRIVTKASALSRAGTRKGSRGAQQPLVTVSPPVTAIVPAKVALQPGSLLAQRGLV